MFSNFESKIIWGKIQYWYLNPTLGKFNTSMKILKAETFYFCERFRATKKAIAIFEEILIDLICR